MPSSYFFILSNISYSYMEQEAPSVEIESPIPATSEKPKQKKLENKPKKTAKPKILRVGHCYSCNHEWTSRTGGDDKPAKCPNCGSYDVIWRDEMLEKKTDFVDITPPAVTATLTPPAQDRNETKEKEQPKDTNKDQIEIKPLTMKQAAEKIEIEHQKIKEDLGPAVSPAGMIIFVGVIAAAGAIWFLSRSGKITLPKIKRPETKEPQPVQQQRQQQQQPRPQQPVMNPMQNAMILRNIVGGRRI